MVFRMSEEDLINELERLDDKNLSIIITLFTHGSLRFNELLRALREYGLKISQPVLSERLKYLIKRKWVTRRRLGKQYVVYELNKDKAETLKLSITPEEVKEILETVLEEGTKFGFELKIVKSTPQEDLEELIRLFLCDLLGEIQFRLKMESTSEISKYLWFKTSLYGRIKENIIRKSLENLDYRMKIIKEIKERLEDC